MSELPSPHAGGEPGHRVGAIIAAGGHSRRMDGVDKLFLPLLGAPLLSYTLAAINNAPSVQSVVLVLSPSNIQMSRTLVAERGFYKVTHICLGGSTRQDSVRAGLQVLPPCDWVVVHDGARPCLESEIVERGLEEARRWGSAVAAIPVQDTIKAADAQGQVSATVDRTGLWAVQTPQIFPWEPLCEAYHGEDGGATDDAALMERLGHPVHLYLGSPANIKVTTWDDSRVAEAVLRQRTEARA